MRWRGRRLSRTHAVESPELRAESPISEGKTHDIAPKLDFAFRFFSQHSALNCIVPTELQFHAERGLDGRRPGR